MNTKAIFIPGNGGGTPRDFWFPYLQKELEKLGIEVIAKDFPDNDLARAEYGLPFIKELVQMKIPYLSGTHQVLLQQCDCRGE